MKNREQRAQAARKYVSNYWGEQPEHIQRILMMAYRAACIHTLENMEGKWSDEDMQRMYDNGRYDTINKNVDDSFESRLQELKILKENEDK